MSDSKIKIGIISEKVMPYRCALYREISKFREIDLEIIFLDDWGLDPRFDPTMNKTYSWGREVLEGFKSSFIKPVKASSVTYTGADKTTVENKLGSLGSVLYYLRTFFGFWSFGVIKHVLSGKFDVVLVENYSSISSLMGILSAKISGARVFLRGEAALNPNLPKFILFLKKIYLGLLFRLFDGYFYSCKSNKIYYLNYGAKINELTFVPSAVDDDFFLRHLDLSKECLRAQLNIPNDSFVYLGVGRIVRRKNWTEAISAFKLACRSNRNLILIIVGDGPELANLQKMIGDQLSSKIIFAGFKSQAEISDFYVVADAMLQTSIYDPSPKVLNESLCFSLPSIVSDAVGTAGDICVDGHNGYVYPIGDVNFLASAIIKLANDEVVYSRFVSNSLELSKLWSLSVGAKNIVSRALRG